MIVPQNQDIHRFTPIQYPADDKSSGVITTHFDYNSISSRLVKLDVLGHDDPTVIRMLEDITGVDVKDVPIGEKNTMKLFSSTEPLGISQEDIDCGVGTFGIPEFGTKFVRTDVNGNKAHRILRINPNKRIVPRHRCLAEQCAGI
jgi:DNA polymerase-3 subunit alpha (Gram-positive type)